MKKHWIDLALGAALALVSFLLLLFARYDQQYVETAVGLLVFFAYSRTVFYAKKHGTSTRELFFAFLAFLGGISLAYLVLWILLVFAALAFSDPTLSI